MQVEDVLWSGAVVGLLFVATLVAALRAEGIAKTRTKEWLPKPPQPSEDLPRLIDGFREQGAADKTPGPLHGRLHAQAKAVDDGIELHRSVIAYFYEQYFMAITVATGAGILAAALLLVISARGWKDCPVPLTVAFLGAASVAALFGSLLTIYKYAKNVSASMTSRDALINLRHQLLTYLATGEDLKGEKMPLKDMLHHVDSVLQARANLAIGFDEKAIRYTDLLERP